MNKSMANVSRIAHEVPSTPAKTEPARRTMVTGAFNLPEDVEEKVISYLERKGAVKDDFDRALDFFLDLSSDFGVGDDRK